MGYLIFSEHVTFLKSFDRNYLFGLFIATDTDLAESPFSYDVKRLEVLSANFLATRV